MRRKNVGKLLILYLSHKNVFCFHFVIANLDVCLLLSREGGAPKTRSKRNNNNKTQKLKMSKHFSMYFWRLFRQNAFDNIFFFSNSSIWIPEESFDVFTNFFELLLPTKMSLVKRFFYSQEFFWIIYCRRIFNFHELSSQNSIFVHRLFSRFFFCEFWNFGIFHIFHIFKS